MGKKEKKQKNEEEELKMELLRASIQNDNFREDNLKYQTIIAYCKHFNTTFHDGEFPHTKKNFMTLRQDIKHEWKMWKSRPFTQKKTWHRLAQSNDPNATIWYFQRSYYEVFQNGVGNCALVAALSSISTHFSIVRRLFPSFRVCEYGVYRVRLCIDGEWKMIVVDDWFPFRNEKGWIATAINNQLWAPLIEKAMAKVHGSYANLISFSRVKAFQFLTGAPTTEYDMRGGLQMPDWYEMKKARSKNYPMTCSTASKEAATTFHLHGYHSFSIIDVCEEQSYRLLRLRNPWGNHKENFDEFGLCPMELKEILTMYYKPVNGSFFIEWTRFLEIWKFLTVCRYRPSWSVIRVTMIVGGLWDNSQKVIRINVQDTCEMCITANKLKGQHSANHIWISIHLVSMEDHDEIEQLVICEPVEHSTKDLRLDPGDYVIIVSELYKSWKINWNIAIHSSIPISAKLYSWNPKMLAGVFQKMVTEFGREIQRIKLDDISIKKYSDDGDTFMIVMAENYTDDKYLHVHIRVDYHKKYYASRRFDTDSTRFADVIPPQSSQILIVLYRHQSFKEKGFPMKIQYRVSNEKLTKVGRSDREAHIPNIHSTEYIHYTTVMDSEFDE